MNFRRARAIFRLEHRVEMKELNSLFRNLVKKYHPDKVRDHPEWAHERMAEINDAYQILAQRISEPEPEDVEVAGSQEEEGDGDFGENFYADSPIDIPPLGENIASTFYEAFHAFLDGLGIFYQYGLENSAIRQEGIRRFRFREALHLLQKGQMALEVCNKTNKHPIIAVASKFAQLTMADINLGKVFVSLAGPLRQYEMRMNNARKAFDEAIKDILFPELVPSHLQGRGKAGLYACYAEFVTYLTVFENDARQKAGLLETARYDAFITLIQLRSLGMLLF